MRESARSEVDDAVASRLRFILAVACMSHDPVELGIRGWSLAAREEPGCLSVRVFGPDGEAATTFAVGADNEAAGRTAWGQVVGEAMWYAQGVSPDTAPLNAPPHPPWLVASLLPAVLAHPEAVGWLADLERWAAWAWLDITDYPSSCGIAKPTVEDIALVDAWLLGGRRGARA